MAEQASDLVATMRGMEVDHEPDGWPAVRMRQISALCDEVERLRAENALLRSGDTCARQCEGAAYRIELRRLAAKLAAAPVAIMDTRAALGLCALTEADFPALYALQGKRVRLLVEPV